MWAQFDLGGQDIWHAINHKSVEHRRSLHQRAAVRSANRDKLKPSAQNPSSRLEYLADGQSLPPAISWLA